MSGGLRLVALACPACGAPIEAEGHDVVYYCTACRSGWRPPGPLDREEGGAVAEGADDEAALLPVEVSFVSLPAEPVEVWKPFWRLAATVRVGRRETWGDRPGAGGTRHRETLFQVPAFRLPIAAAIALARRWTLAPGNLGERLGERLTGAVHGPEEAMALARWMALRDEVERPDDLQSLHLELDIRRPELLAVPFDVRGGVLVDRVHGRAV